MTPGPTIRVATTLAAALVFAAGCGTRAEDDGAATGGGEAGGDIETGVGVEGDTISLGALTDLTGVFAALGRDITNANELYWQDNEVCGQYSVELNVQDAGYNVQRAVQLYSSMEPQVLAMQQLLGSPINTALAPELESDELVSFPSAWSETLTLIPGTGVPGATYDIEMANLYDYAFSEGLIAEGDTVGHIYFEGEYGANGLEGSEYVAEQRNLTLIEREITPQEQDMSAIVSQFRAEGVDAIALTVAPGQTASVAAAAQSQGLDVPLLGSNPVFAPGLLDGAAAEKLKEDLYVASPVSSFDANPEILAAYEEAFPDAPPSLGVLVGYGMSAVMDQVLEEACANGALTRESLLEAFNSLENIETGGVLVPIESFEQGMSPSLQSFILRPADVPGGATVAADAFEGEFSADLAPAD